MDYARDRNAAGPTSCFNGPSSSLTGPRETGKTSLVQRSFPQHEFVSLDLPSEAEQAEHDPRAFLARHRPPLVVDEVQYAPQLFRHLGSVQWMRIVSGRGNSDTDLARRSSH